MRHLLRETSAWPARAGNATGGASNALEEPMNVPDALGTGTNPYHSIGWKTGQEPISSRPGYVRLEWRFTLATMEIHVLGEVMAAPPAGQWMPLATGPVETPVRMMMMKTTLMSQGMKKRI
jgi:hypothetical protein